MPSSTWPSRALIVRTATLVTVFLVGALLCSDHVRVTFTVPLKRDVGVPRASSTSMRAALRRAGLICNFSFAQSRDARADAVST